MRLRHNDWKKLFAALARLYSAIEPSTLGARAIAAVSELASGEITAFDFFDSSGSHTGQNWQNPIGSITQDEYDIFVHVVHEHPFISDMIAKGRRDAMKTTDFMSAAQFRRTAIYNEFFSLFPLHHQLSVALSADDNLIVTCTVGRQRSDFTEDERLMFNLIAPHLSNAIRNGRKLQKIFSAEANLDSAMAAKSSGIVTLGTDRRVEFVSHYARGLLEKYFGHRDFQGKYLPEKLGTWVEKCDPGNRAILNKDDATFVLRLDDSKLSISLIPDGNANETILILEESRKASPLDLTYLGMTKRQTEVLFWISQGKTDKDIALLLGISPRTVHKHAENIYVSLGVETRTAAMAAASKTP